MGRTHVIPLNSGNTRSTKLKKTRNGNSTFRLSMKKLLPFFLFYLGVVGCATCRAETFPLDERVYKSTIAADGVQRVRIDGGSYFFRPSRVIVRVNVPVELTVSVDSSLVPHSFVIQAPEAGVVVDQSLSRDAKTIRFTPTAAGKYPFYCNSKLLFFKSHREKGMEGLLDVVE
jgi:plastocyanin